MSGTSLMEPRAPQDTRPHAAPEPEQLSRARAVVLHLWPAVVFVAFILVAVPRAAAWGIDPLMVMFGGIPVVLVPLELGYLAVHARRTTGSWSPLAAVTYREPLRLRRLAPLALGLAAWFTALLVVSMVAVDGWMARTVLSWLPDTILQFSAVEDDGQAVSAVALAVMLLIAAVCNVVLGPVTEELYFRGHLLPRLERYGRWAPVLNTALFALYHLHTPWRIPAIFVGFLPTAWMVRRTRSVRLGIAAHMTVNFVFVLLLTASFFAARGA